MENDIVTIQMDITGRSEIITKLVNELNLEIKQAEERHIDGANIINIVGSSASIIQLLNIFQPSTTVSVCITAGVMILVYAPKAIELIRQNKVKRF